MSETSHKCHVPGCTAEVSPEAWACADHWRRIPVDYRRQIVPAYRAGAGVGSDAYTRIEELVLKWIQAQIDRTRA